MIRYDGLEPIILADVPNVVITGTAGDDILVVDEAADSFTVRTTNNTLESVTFAKARLQSLSIDGLAGYDSITMAQPAAHRCALVNHPKRARHILI